MKKTIVILICVLFVLTLLPGCGSTAASQQSGVPASPVSSGSQDAPAEKLRIVTTIFPEYDWVMNLLGDRAENAEVTLLLDNRVDLHSYQPTVEDIVRISGCDLFVYVGGESDGWVEGALAEAANKNMLAVNLLETLGDSVKEEELVEGMEAEEEEHEEEAEYDEHVWLSLKNADVLCRAIAAALEQIDPAHAESYRANLDVYTEKLAALDCDYRDAVDAAPVKTLLFGDRFPFRYLVDDYGLEYYAAFMGCSAETEASFETIVFLARKVDELGLKAICRIESSDGSIAATIRENTQSRDQEILVLDSMQSTTSKDAAEGANYLGIMNRNLSVLKSALQQA